MLSELISSRRVSCRSHIRVIARRTRQCSRSSGRVSQINRIRTKKYTNVPRPKSDTGLQQAAAFSVTRLETSGFSVSE